MGIESLFESYPSSFIVTVVLFGLIIGSFLNVVIYRLPIMLWQQWRSECEEWLANADTATPKQDEPYNLVFPRSSCRSCGHLIRAAENIPVISYLVLRGRCASCGAAISLQYPLIELLTAVLSFTVAWHFGYSWQTAAGLLLTWAILALSVIDLQTKLLPDAITLPFLWLGLLINMAHTFTDLPSSVLGALLGYLSLWTIYQLFKLLTGKEGMGYGDFKLLSVFGAWLGWQRLPLIILLSSLAGAIVGIGLVLFKGQDKNCPLPFGPYLAVAGWIALLWGNEITNTYLEYAIN